jgi:hypothetical protein
METQVDEPRVRLERELTLPMCARPNIAVWKRVKEAVTALGGETTKRAVRDWILRTYPGTETGTITCQILICTVNRQSRVRFWQNERPRLATAQYDFLFENPGGGLVFYSRRKHGDWEIAKTQQGLVARSVDPVVFKKAEKILARGGGFGDSATNRLVERAAIKEVTRHLRREKFRVKSREKDGIGYDLDAFRAGEELHVEVKGVSGTKLQFPITRGEVRRAERDPFVGDWGSYTTCLPRILRLPSMKPKHTAL